MNEGADSPAPPTSRGSACASSASASSTYGRAAAISNALGEEREVKLPQGTVRYRERGEGEPIVFVHGLLVNGDRVVVRILDPARAEFYAARGLRTVCPTSTAISILTDAVRACEVRPRHAAEPRERVAT